MGNVGCAADFRDHFFQDHTECYCFINSSITPVYGVQSIVHVDEIISKPGRISTGCGDFRIIILYPGSVSGTILFFSLIVDFGDCLFCTTGHTSGDAALQKKYDTSSSYVGDCGTYHDGTHSVFTEYWEF